MASNRYVICFLFYSCCFVQLALCRNPTWRCSDNNDCETLEGGQCENGYCLCPEGFSMSEDNTKCDKDTTAPYIHSNCTEHKDCRRLVTGFECHAGSKTCECQEEFNYFVGRCWRTVEIGQPCTSSLQCLDPLQPFALVCSGSVCECGPDFYQREVMGDCRMKAKAINDSCIIDEDCSFIESVEGAICNLATMKCEDPVSKSEGNNQSNGFWESQYSTLPSTSMLPRSNESKSCSIDLDCADMKAAYCNARRCFCNQGYYLSEKGDRCLAEIGVEKPIDDTCNGFATADIGGICKCPVGFFHSYPFRDCIKPTRRFGEACANDLSCRTFGQHAYCTKDPVINTTHCACDTSASTINIDSQFCEPFLSFINGSCVNNTNCPDTAECIDEICTCPKGTIANPTNVVCLATDLNVGDQCSISEQCTGIENLACVNEKCGCASGYILDEGVCVSGIGGPCSEDSDCSKVPDSECKEFNETTVICQCKQGFVGLENVCYKAATTVQDECEIDLQCYSIGDNASIHCIEEQCMCKTGYHFRDQFCHERKALGEVCTGSSQCFIFGNVYDSECRNSLCQCNYGYRTTFNPDRCNSATLLHSSVWISLLMVSLVAKSLLWL